MKAEFQKILLRTKKIFFYLFLCLKCHRIFEDTERFGVIPVKT